MKDFETITCDECGSERQIDVSDLQKPTEKEVARRAGFAMTQNDILCPECWDTVNPIG